VISAADRDAIGQVDTSTLPPARCRNIRSQPQFGLIRHAKNSPLATINAIAPNDPYFNPKIVILGKKFRIRPKGAGFGSEKVFSTPPRNSAIPAAGAPEIASCGRLFSTRQCQKYADRTYTDHRHSG